MYSTTLREAFGKNVTTDQSTLPLGFPGQWQDRVSNLADNFHRYYVEETGRYQNLDPIGLNGGLNLFSYAAQNPVKNIDPIGLIHWKAAYGEAGLAYPVGPVVSIGEYALHFYLESDCVLNSKVKANVLALRYGPNVGLSFPVVALTFSTAEFEDGCFSTQPDPHVFEGVFVMKGLSSFFRSWDCWVGLGTANGSCSGYQFSLDLISWAAEREGLNL